MRGFCWFLYFFEVVTQWPLFTPDSADCSGNVKKEVDRRINYVFFSGMFEKSFKFTRFISSAVFLCEGLI